MGSPATSMADGSPAKKSKVGFDLWDKVRGTGITKKGGRSFEKLVVTAAENAMIREEEKTAFRQHVQDGDTGWLQQRLQVLH